MEQLKYAAIAAIALAVGELAALGFGHRAAGLILGVGLIGVLIFLLIKAVSQANLMDFLIRENKQWKSKVIYSDDDVKQLDKQRRQSELNALQYQINPHFLYNTLDTIRGQALLDEELDIAQMTEKLSRFFRYSISNRDTIVRVEEEIRHIEDYLYIQKKRFGDRFDTEIRLETPEISDFYMLKLLLQPLVENAITHGLERMREKGHVCISFFKTEKKLLIHVEDNGVGIPEEKLFELNDKLKSTQVFVPERPGRHNGIAVQNVNARIRMTFGEEYGMHYRSAVGEGTTVVVSLPLVDDFARIRYLEEKR